MLVYQGADDEDGLIARVVAGDRAAFEPLVDRYYGPLFRVALRLLGNREEARDATQTAFLKAYQALSTCERGRRFFSWIYRILLNDCLNTLRARRPTEPLADAAPASAGGDPVEALEIRQIVRHALLLLTAEQREVIVLRHFAELSYDEMASTLGIPAKTVKSRLYSARQRLGELLATAATNLSHARVYFPSRDQP